VEKRQALGLATNGRDPLRGPHPSTDESAPDSADPLFVPTLHLRKGREHLMRVLDLLARVEVVPEDDALPLLDLLSRKSLGLPWGSTVVVITSREVEGLMDTLLALRRRGLLVILVLTSPDQDFAVTAQRADQIGVQAHRVWSEGSLDVWR
jgi:hypothetical protein